MRSAQKNNRARGRGNRKSTGNVINRVFDSSGPEGKVRGTPQQIIDKYVSLARDAQTSGDRVAAENFLQHAEHYQRLLLQANAAQAERRDQPQDGSNDTADDDDQPETENTRQHSDESRRQQSQPSGRKEGFARPEPELSGLTTIDSGGEQGDSLLVTTEDVASSQPRRPRRNNRANGAGQSAEIARDGGTAPDNGKELVAQPAAGATSAETTSAEAASAESRPTSKELDVIESDSST